jgi:hypothetical protein
MIFWFRAHDGIISLILLVIWVLSITALSIILFNEGVSFSQTGRSTSQEIFVTPPDTLHIVIDKKVKDLPARKEFSLPENHYTVFIEDSGDRLFVRSRLQLMVTNDKLAKVEIRKRSSGRDRINAAKKAESLIYGYRINKDTLFLDEYFSVPSGSKWSADEIRVYLFLPEKTILHFDNSSENMFPDRISLGKIENDNETASYVGYDIEPWQLGDKYWRISENGLKEVERANSKQK